MKSGGRFKGGRFAHSSRSAPLRDTRAGYEVNGLVPDIVGDFRQGVFLSPTTSGFGSLFAYSRASVGSYTGPAGKLALAAAGEPRIDYQMQNGQWVKKGLLLEGEARTNLMLRSSEFENSVWSKSRASVVANDEMAPDGSMTACRLISTASTFDGAVRQSVSYAIGQRLSFSVYAKAGDRDFVFLRERSHGFAKDSYFNLQQGAPGTVNSVHTAQMKDVGNGWYRCSITVQANWTATSDFEIYNSEDDLNTASAQPGFTFIWGAQVEIGASSSSYIETQDIPATRAADELTLKATQTVDPLAANAVSLAVSGGGDFANEAGPVKLLDWSDGAGSHIAYQVATDTPNAGRVELVQSAGGASTVVTTVGGVVGPGVPLGGYDEPETLSYQIDLNCPSGADVRHYQPSLDLFGRITAGYLEPMFGGISAELLWFPFNSSVAFGAELNYVRQRNFDQLLGFQDYSVATGHVSGYWQMQGGYHLQIDAGRYLAGDWGSTLTLNREFGNGWRIGAFATFTNVSAADFGEGSFDKGVIVTIPIDWLSGTPSRDDFTTVLRPVQRDGGARLEVAGRLYDTVRGLRGQDLRASWGRFWR